MFKWLTKRLDSNLDKYYKRIADIVAIKEQQYPIGTKYIVIEELPLSEGVLLPGAIGTVKECMERTVLLRFNLSDYFARDVWLIYERLEKELKISL